MNVSLLRALSSRIIVSGQINLPFITRSISIHTRERTNEQSNVLKDTFNRNHTYLRISLTERCNLRCQYCMPEEGVSLQPTPNLLTKDEIVRVANLFASVGVNKIRLTGGEPLVRKDIYDIAEEIGKIENIKTLAITTNGITLARKLPRLRAAGVNLLNISLDTLDPAKFTQITRRLGWEKVMESINTAIDYGYDPVKVNCVVMRGINDNELVDFVELTRNKPICVRFIEFMPFGGNKWSDDKLLPYQEMIKVIQRKYSQFQKSNIPDGPNETARSYQVAGFRGSVGFITSMSDHFCGTCNRLRITADGNLKVCLFGNEEVSLRDAMRNGSTDSELLKIIQTAVTKKKPSHGVGLPLHPLLKVQKSSTVIVKAPVYSHIQYRTYSRDKDQVPLDTSTGTHVAQDTMTGLTHVVHDAEGHATPTMVSIVGKQASCRSAHARSIVCFPAHILQALIANKQQKQSREDPENNNPEENFKIKELSSPKGPIFTTAIIAGTMAVKSTHNLIPFCHPLPVEHCKITIQIHSNTEIVVDCKVKVTHKTGVEMEALVGASVASLTIYDMCKALSHEIVIKETKLIKKTGGKSDYHVQ